MGAGGVTRITCLSRRTYMEGLPTPATRQLRVALPFRVGTWFIANSHIWRRPCRTTPSPGDIRSLAYLYGDCRWSGDGLERSAPHFKASAYNATIIACSLTWRGLDRYRTTMSESKRRCGICCSGRFATDNLTAIWRPGSRTKLDSHGGASCSRRVIPCSIDAASRACYHYAFLG